MYAHGYLTGMTIHNSVTVPDKYVYIYIHLFKLDINDVLAEQII